MANQDDILADNLKEALRQAHKHIVFGTSASLFLMLLVIQDWWESGEKNIKIPLIDVSAPSWLAEAIACAAYFVSGYLAYLAVTRARRIMGRLRFLPQIREAVLMYPSIPTIIITGTRIAAIALPVLIFLTSTVPFLFTMTGDSWQGLLLFIFILCTPWVLLIQQLRYPLSEIKYKLTERSFQQLLAGGVPDDVLTKLQVIRDKEYPNRDQFLDALQRAAGKAQLTRITGLILTHACEEEGIEN